MDILCLMGLFPNEYREQIEKDTKLYMQNAADKLQWALVDGLDHIEGAKIKIVNSLYVGSYPRKYRRAQIPTFPFQHRKGACDINVGFCNISGIKRISKYRGIQKEIRKWAQEESAEKKVLIIYALTTPFVNIAKYVKAKYPHIKVCIVVPDLPEYMNVAQMERKGLYYHVKRMEIAQIRKCIGDVDGYVLLTDAMKEWFDGPITYTVVEGIAAASGEETETQQAPQRKKQILYAGGIKAEYGVLDMARAFRNINEAEWELVIYGDGADMPQLQTIASECKNIILGGRVPNAQVIEAQRRASVLMNPRKNQEYTKYSFPSKVLEYMSSGTPVLMYRLDGIPEEYDRYYYHIEETENGMETALKRVMQLSRAELSQMGESAREFVTTYKNSEKQCRKIYDMLMTL